MFNFLKQMKDIVNQATQLWQESRDGKGKEGWIVFFEARSFWLAVVGVVFAALAITGVVPPFGEEIVTETVLQIVSFAAFAWSFIERVKGKKTVVWSPEQANTAIKAASNKAKK